MNSITLDGVTFRWDEEKQALLITTPADQKALTGSSAAQLLDFLLSMQQEIYAAEQARELPTWAHQPAHQILRGQIIEEQPRRLGPGSHLPSRRQTQEEQP